MPKVFFIAAAIGVLLAIIGNRSVANEKPNIVFVMVDDAGLGDFSTYGGELIKTPVMDEMAREGMTFQNAYSGSAVCGPTRCVVMTGLHTGHCVRRANRTAKRTLLPLDANTPTVASMLRRAGYATGGFGKWGLGNRGTTGVPEKLGFDTWYGYYDQVHAHNYYPEFLVRNSIEVPLPGNANGRKETYTHYLIEDETIRFIEENKDGPFFVYAAWTPPHSAYVIPDTDPAMDYYRDKEWSQKNKNYAAMVTRLDAGVGRILKKLKELEIDDNTLVIYTSDNGANGQFKKLFNSTAGLRGAKRSLYEGGTRAPFVARWPGTIAAASTSEVQTTHVDLMATAAEIAGTESPVKTDGISILPTLTGRTQKITHQHLYFEIYEGLYQQSVRKGDWKGYRRGNVDLELYNLVDDPNETKNIAAQHPNVVSDLEKILIAEHVPSPHFIGPTQLKNQPAGKQQKKRKRQRNGKQAKNRGERNRDAAKATRSKTDAILNVVSKNQKSRKPNIVILYSDDAGYADFGFQPNCKPDMREMTPNIDTIAGAGARFTNAYMSGCVCSPSRAGLMTGRYQQRFGFDNNLPPGTQNGLSLNEVFGAKRLRAMGYRTGLVGKWHLGYPADFHPNERGFDWFYGLLQGSRPYFPMKKPTPHRVVLENKTPTAETGYATDRFGDAAARFINENKEDPFFLFVSFTSPHGPLQPNPKDLDRVSHIENARRQKYAGLVVSLDDNVGKVLKALKDNGLDENTLVIFTNDNGGQTALGADNMPLKGKKGQLTEGGIRVPWAMRWPGTIKPGTVVEQPIIALDILPTLIEAAGETVSTEWKLDGRSIVPLLSGDSLPTRPLHWRTGGKSGSIACREGQWKFIHQKRADNSKAFELYDLNADLSETENLASQNPEIVKSLKAKSDAWESELMDPLWGMRKNKSKNGKRKRKKKDD